MDPKKLMAIAAVPAMLAFGALGFTQQGNAQNNSATSQAQTTQQAENKGTDTDNVQQGDQTSPDKPGQAEEQKAKGPDRDNVQQGDQTSPDKPGQAEEQKAKGPDRDNIQQGGGNQVEDGKPDLPGAASKDGD